MQANFNQSRKNMKKVGSLFHNIFCFVLFTLHPMSGRTQDSNMENNQNQIMFIADTPSRVSNYAHWFLKQNLLFKEGSSILSW